MNNTQQNPLKNNQADANANEAVNPKQSDIGTQNTVKKQAPANDGVRDGGMKGEPTQEDPRKEEDRPRAANE